MGSVVAAAGIVVYGLALLCVPVSLGRHRHPLHAAHCRANGLVRGSRDEIRALDMMCALTMLPRWTAAASFAFRDARLFAVVVLIEALAAAIWAGQRTRMVFDRQARLRRRQAA